MSTRIVLLATVLLIASVSALQHAEYAPPPPTTSTPSPTSECSTLTNCTSCTNVYPCGWCTQTNTCQLGGWNGSATCSPLYWEWTQGQCSAPTFCPSTLSCYQCTALEGCGFCTVGGCMAGSASGSTTGCSGTWEYNRTQCTITYAPTAPTTTRAPTTAAPPPPLTPVPTPPPIECGNYHNCTDCVGMFMCGWCTTTNTCEAGNWNSSVTGCSGKDWDWVYRTCPGATTAAPPQTTAAPTGSICPSTLSCYQCTALEGCGFCTVGGCMVGSASGSTTGCSGTWEYNVSQCTMTYPPTPAPTTLPPAPTGSCPNTFSCHKCTLLEGCEYCSSSGCIRQGASCSGTVVMNFTSCPSS